MINAIYSKDVVHYAVLPVEHKFQAKGEKGPAEAGQTGVTTKGQLNKNDKNLELGANTKGV